MEKVVINTEPVPETSPAITSTPIQETAAAVVASGTDTPGPVPSPVEKSENGTPNKKGWPKGKKRKKAQKDHTAPRQPLTGYVRFLNDRRDKFRAENPNMPFAEITKVLAAEWSALPHDQKQQYLVAAEQDRERYLQEVAAYKQSEAYKLFSEQQASKKPKEESEETLQEPDTDVSAFDIPIFTEEFLDHNKVREAELRQLRKSNTDYEQQNATIQTYIAGLHNAIEKLSVETQQQRSNNNALEQHLQHLRTVFSAAFTAIPVPGLEPPSSSSIDEYVIKLTAFVKEDPNNAAVITIKNTISQLDVQA